MPWRTSIQRTLLVSCMGFVPAQDAGMPGWPPEPPQRLRTKEELAGRQAKMLYGVALLRLRNDSLLEAVKLLEQARSLDPEAAAIQRALIPLYAALQRSEEALAACRKLLEQTPEDHETLRAYAGLLLRQGRRPEARTALKQAAACPALADDSDLYVQIHGELAALHEDLKEHEAAAETLARAARRLDQANHAGQDESRQQAASLHERTIRLWIDAGRYDRALAAFQGGIEKHPILATRLNLQLARGLAADGQLESALERIEDYLRTLPVSTEGYELLASLLPKLGRGADVLPRLEEFSRRDPHNLALQVLVGRQLVRTRNWARAEEHYRELLAGNESSPDIHRGILHMYCEQGKADKALQEVNLAFARAGVQDLLPGDPRAAARARAMAAVLREDRDLGEILVAAAHNELDRGRFLRPDTCFALAAVAARARQWPAAERLYRRCLEADLNEPMELAVYDGLLRVLWEAKKYDAIVWLCERGLRNAAGANRVVFHMNHARALALVGKAEEAAAEAERLVAAAEGEALAVARIVRLRVLWHVGQEQQLLAECHKMLQEPLAPALLRDVRQLLAAVYAAQREYAKAEEQLQRILKEDPGDAAACNDLGYLWADQGKNLAEAERLIRKAIDLDRELKSAAAGDSERGPAEKTPPPAAYLDSLGWVRYRQGHWLEARQWLQLAATLPEGEDDPVVWDHLGDVYSRMGDTAAAAAAWKKALELCDKHKRRRPGDRSFEIRRKLQQMKGG